MDYKTVFEITEKGFEIIRLTPLLFLIIGVGICWYNIKLNKKASTKRRFAIVLGFILSGFASLMFLLTVPKELATRRRIKNIYKSKKYKVIEGVVENFHPMPYGGHEYEKFTVNDTPFEYSDYYLFYGFNNTASHGGPINGNGQTVRLSYITVKKENRILKIELKILKDSISE